MQYKLGTERQKIFEFVALSLSYLANKMNPENLIIDIYYFFNYLLM